MSGDIPEWASDRACELFKAEEKTSPAVTALQWCNAFARYIAAHEEPPVDPLLIEARKIADAYCCEHGFDHTTDIMSGRFDDNKRAGVPLALTALRRGYELASKEPTQ